MPASTFKCPTQCCASSRTVLTVRNSSVSVKNSYDLIGTVTVDLPNIDIDSATIARRPGIGWELNEKYGSWDVAILVQLSGMKTGKLSLL